MSLQSLSVPILDAQFKTLNVESNANFGTSIILNAPDGAQEIMNFTQANGYHQAQDYQDVGTWNAQTAYPQGSWVSYSGSNWYKTSAGLSTVGVAPVAGPDWSNKVAGSAYAATTIEKDTLNLLAGGPQLAMNNNPQGVGLSSVWNDYPASVLPNPVYPAGSAHTLSVNGQLQINAPAPTSAQHGTDAVLSLSSTSLSAGNPESTFTFYNGVGNPGGGAPPNALTLYGYPGGGGLAALLTTTPCVDLAGPPVVNWGASGDNPALLQFISNQQSGRVNIASGASTSAITCAGIGNGSIVFAQVLGEASAVGATSQISPAEFDATLTNVIADTSVAGTITLRGNGNATSANGVVVEYFIVRL